MSREKPTLHSNEKVHWRQTNLNFKNGFLTINGEKRPLEESI